MTALLLSFFLLAAPPPSQQISMAVSTQKKILVVRLNGQDVKHYDVAVGTKNHPTPMGRFGVRHIVWNPRWVPPNANWSKGKKPTGPADPKNPMKVVKLFFNEPDYYIHGTDQEDSIGAAASHGCIRMAQADVYDLARFVMQNGGAPHPDGWYAEVINTTKPADVQLPKAIPLVIGK